MFLEYCQLQLHNILYDIESRFVINNHYKEISMVHTAHAHSHTQCHTLIGILILWELKGAQAKSFESVFRTTTTCSIYSAVWSIIYDSGTSEQRTFWDQWFLSLIILSREVFLFQRFKFHWKYSLGQEILFFIERFLYYVLNTESPFSEIPLYCYTLGVQSW